MFVGIHSAIFDFSYLSPSLQLLESFGAGTAAVISPVNGILYDGKTIEIPTGSEAGPFAMKMWRTLTDIQYGKVDHPWSVKI